MNLGAWLPQVLALIPSLGAALVTLLINRRRRAINELEKLLELRLKCKDNTSEARSLDAAIASVADKLSERLRRRVSGSGVAAVAFMGLVFLTASYWLWFWAFQTGIWIAWVVAPLVTFLSVVVVIGGFPSVFKKEAEVISE